MTDTKILFKPVQVGCVQLKNRIAMPPMDTNYGNLDGTLSRKHYSYLSERAKGGAGLLIVEATSVSFPYGKISERQLKMNDNTVTTEWHDLTDTVHSLGAKIMVQLHHGGFMAVPAYCGGAESVTACATNYEGSPWPPAREMSLDEVKEVINDFIKAAQIAQAAGLDGVEIHASHMYLINQFMTPLINQRTDEYGGNFENRGRMLREIVEGIRKACPKPFIVGVRLGVVDHIPGGITLEDGVEYAKMCEAAGADMLNLSCGFYTSVNQSTESQWDEEGSRLYMSEAVKKAVSIPVAIVGKLRTPEFCAKAIEDNKADILCIGRQLICDPAWVNKIHFKKFDEIRPCLNCDDGCLGQFYFAHGNVHCTMNPYVGYEDLYHEDNVPAVAKPRNIVIVGGGVAGMQFAIIAKKRGHNVTILEKTDRLGGQMIIAGVAPFKSDLVKGLSWFTSEVARLGIEVQLNTEATAKTINKMGADVVIVATGSLPNTPPIPGVENTVESWNLLNGSVKVPENKKVVIIGGGIVGSEVAHMLIENGCDVTLLEMLPTICNGLEPMHKGNLTTYLNEKATIHLEAKVTKIEANSVSFTDKDGVAAVALADMVVISTGQHSVGTDLYDALIDKDVETYKIGDCNTTGNIRSATRAALEVAYMI